MSRPLFYGPDGEPIDVERWAELTTSTVRIVGLDRIGDLIVSTIWLGVDHGLGLGEKPLIFETMVFEQSSSGQVRRLLSEFTGRYSSAAEAWAGHVRTVERVQLIQEHQ